MNDKLFFWKGIHQYNQDHNNDNDNNTMSYGFIYLGICGGGCKGKDIYFKNISVAVHMYVTKNTHIHTLCVCI